MVVSLNLRNLWSEPHLHGLDFGGIVRALRHCGRVLDVNHGRSMHSKLIKHGICGNIFVGNNLITMYSDLELQDDAQKVFDGMPERNVVSWTALISAHNHAGNPSEALEVFSRMVDCGLEEPNGYTFCAALKSCAMAGDLGLGKWIHKRVFDAKLEFDTVLMNAIVDMYVKCGSLDDAWRVFDGIASKNATSWNAMIAGYCKEDRMVDAEKLFHDIPRPDAATFNSIVAGFAQIESPKALAYIYMMHKQNVKLDQFTFPCAMKACGGFWNELLGRQIHSYIIRSGFEFRDHIGSSLVDMYAKCGQMDVATRLFDDYLTCKGSNAERLALWNSMVSGFATNGYNNSALNLISQIHRTGYALDAFTLSSTLKVCINLQNLRIGQQVHGLIVTTGYLSDHIVASVLVDVYAKSCRIEDALKLFSELPYKDIVAWSAVINGCMQHGSNDLGFSLFKEMMKSRMELDHFVISVILKGCSCTASLEAGKQLHAHCIKDGFEQERVVVTSLIDMYSKCGDIEEGLSVFRTATERDAVCWTGMIAGCGNNGRAKEAMEFFVEMLGSGKEPNEITFLGLLSACRHAGLVAEACNFFKEMKDKHGITPLVEHYCCMADILSRAGRLEELKQLMKDMPYEIDQNMLNSLLGSDGIHQTGNFGELVSPNVLPQRVSLSNSYASMGMWDSSAKLREGVRRTALKEAGRSWVEVRA